MVKKSLNQSDFKCLKSDIKSKSNLVDKRDFMYRETDWKKIKDDLNAFMWVGSKNALNQSECRIAESNISQIRIDEWTWFFGMSI